MKMSRVESAMRVSLAFYKAYNRHDIDGMMQLIEDDCLLETSGPAPDGVTYTGKEAVARYWKDFFRESPTIHIEIEEIFGLGMRCIARWKISWQETDEQTSQIRGADIFRVKNDLISEQFSYNKH